MKSSVKSGSYGHRRKNTVLNLPLIVEDNGLGLMLESIKKEHLVREGVLREKRRNIKGLKTDDFDQTQLNSKQTTV